MNKLNEITGLEDNQHVINKLNDLLASIHIYYQNIKSFHWNIRGPQFFRLHEEFQKLYEVAEEQIDQIAERIMMIGGEPLQTLEDYIKYSKIAENNDKYLPEVTINKTLDNLNILLSLERDILKSTNEDDEGTRVMIGNFIAQQEKVVWMFYSNLD